jgi:hemoglobin/transferrin/lactoferrin receptor protein
VRLVYGFEAYRDSQSGTRNGTARPEFPDAEVDFVAGFAEATVALTDSIDIVPGLRIDHFSLAPEAAGLPDRSESAISPRLALNWRPAEGLQLFGSVGQAFRAPSLTELYTDGLHFRVPGGAGPGTVVENRFVPNPNLDPEKALQFEIGARLDRQGVLMPADRLTMGVNAYYADVRDYVDTTVTFISGPPSFVGGSLVFPGTTTSSNVDAELWGFEAEARYDVGLWYAGFGGMIPRGRENSGEALGSIPADRVNLTLGVRPLAGIEIGGRATFAARQDDVPSGALPTSGYAVYDLFASWDPTPAVTLRAGIDNLLDRDYRIHPNGLDNPGRSFKLSASVRF